MEGHTWIYVITILLYLWHLSKVYDGHRRFLMKKNRIHAPTNQGENMNEYLIAVRKFKRQFKQFKVRSFGIFFVIPTIEIVFHLVLGNYQLNGFLLTVLFLLLFFSCLVFILYAMKGKGQTMHGKKYTKTPNLFID